KDVSLSPGINIHRTPLGGGSFETSDGRLRTQIGKAMVIRDGESMSADAEYVIKKDKKEELIVDNFYRDEVLYFSVPYRRIMSGDLYKHENLKDDSNKTNQRYNWGPQGFNTGTEVFAAVHNGTWIYPLYANSSYEDLTVRVMYYERDVAAVFYIYAEFTTSPYEIEALCAVDLSTAEKAEEEPSGGGSSDGGLMLGITCHSCGGSGRCSECGGSGHIYRRGSEGARIKTGCDRCYGSGKCNTCGGDGEI
ncbi:MAG: hypothetical protein ACI4TH_05845, partial [Candidatus Ornithomonoglobus sp.]